MQRKSSEDMSVHLHNILTANNYNLYIYNHFKNCFSL